MFVYNFIVWLAVQGIRVVALWNPKMRLWVNGRKQLYERMQAVIKPEHRVVWFHAASLGEFEEGRPIIEKFREQHPQFKILLTFYSPSGYEVRRNYTGADWVFYLPADTKSDMKQFMDIVHPEIAVFIKYEFWFNMLAEIKRRDINAYVVSARFIADSRFFKWYGGAFRNALRTFKTLFVQDKISVELLQGIGITNVVQAGDPRFDRVAEIAANPWENAIVNNFKNNSKVFIAGSTCGASDDDLVLEFINRNPDVKFIVVPHDLNPEPVQKYLQGVKMGAICYSDCTVETDFTQFQVLIYNTIGTLAMLYRYGNWAYIGGGFIAGIHSVIEATIYGLPCVFGPNYQKNRPGVEMIASGACSSVHDIETMQRWFIPLKDDNAELSRVSNIAAQYTRENAGATAQILSQIVSKTGNFQAISKN